MNIQCNVIYLFFIPFTHSFYYLATFVQIQLLAYIITVLTKKWGNWVALKPGFFTPFVSRWGQCTPPPLGIFKPRGRGDCNTRGSQLGGADATQAARAMHLHGAPLNGMHQDIV